MTKQMTRAEIKANREKWAAGLQEPHRKKLVGLLGESLDGKTLSKGCCLGHGCEILGIGVGLLSPASRSFGHENIIEFDGEPLVAPSIFVNLVGLIDSDGTSFGFRGRVKEAVFSHNFPGKGARFTLSSWNDRDKTSTPQIIGAWLAQPEVIEGGKGTPYIPLAKYPE